jgi:23S rRNA (uracil1939-C5)-methyltransferase
MGSYDERDSSPETPEMARLTLENMGPLGDTNALFEGESINVFGGLPGEEVIARIVRYRRRRRRYVSGLVTEVVNPSPHRVAPPCPYYGPCSGCQWQHVEYAHQLHLKRDAVESQLRRYEELAGVPVSPTAPDSQTFNYRNHARFTVRAQGFLGFSNRITRAFVRIDTCMLMSPWINETLALIQGRCRETTQLSMRYGVNTGEWLVQPTLQNPEIPLATGQAHYSERLLGQRFRIGSPSFFQVNTRQAEHLVELVRARLGLNPDTVLVDAYSGVGAFAVLLAPSVRKVIAIEESSAAMKDAAVNCRGIENLQAIEGKTEDVLDALEEASDAVILDPPRVGCHPDTLASLVRTAPRRIVYVSCEPETLARDLSTLVRGGFRVSGVEPVDMFPQTYHVECVATLELEQDAEEPFRPSPGPLSGQEGARIRG